MFIYSKVALISLIFSGCLQVNCNYDPNWKSLDSRPLPPWFDEAKIGIFLHWGLFSVPSFGEAWFWKNWKDGSPRNVDFMKKNYPPGFTYQDFGPMFKAEFYDPDQWAKLFEDSGAKYVVLTSKHHEGFTMWPSKYSWGWNAMDLGPARDLLGELASAIRKRKSDLHFGLYHSLYEWYNPLYLSDKGKNFTTNDFVRWKTMPELYELVNTYLPEVVWSDGDWEASDVYWNSTEFLSWLFNYSPVKDTVVVNDRWGIGIPCNHGSYYTCKDKYNPRVLQYHKWENCMTLDRNYWGYNRLSLALDYLTIHELLTVMAETISCGGNLLVNAGPTHDGRIPTIMEERLRQMGEWLKINGEAVYKTSPWKYQNDSYTSGVWYTQSLDVVYAIVLNWPPQDLLILGSVQSTGKTTIHMIATGKPLLFKLIPKGLEVVFPEMSTVSSKWAWVLIMRFVNPKGSVVFIEAGDWGSFGYSPSHLALGGSCPKIWEWLSCSDCAYPNLLGIELRDDGWI